MAAAARVEQVRRLVVDHRPNRLVDDSSPGQGRPARAHRLVLFAEERHLGQRRDVEQAGAQAVVDIVVVVRDLVGEIRDLRLQRRLAAVQKTLAERAEPPGVARDQC